MMTYILAVVLILIVAFAFTVGKGTGREVYYTPYRLPDVQRAKDLKNLLKKAGSDPAFKTYQNKYFHRITAEGDRSKAEKLILDQAVARAIQDVHNALLNSRALSQGA